ncbi:MAG: hypothetical protein WKF92_08265 [Pyrinomonadaceae bacterium]
MFRTFFLEFGKFEPHAALKICLCFAVILSAAMALKSEYNRHPDEIHHFEAAKYYQTHFFPPAIGVPSVRDSYSTYGVSYLNYHWAEYFFAGKFMLLISPLIQSPLIAARFFSVFLFSILAGLFIYRSQDNSAVFIITSFLLITPQIWYVFSYVNNDAFALFVSVAAAYQLAYPKSLLNKFLETIIFREGLWGRIWFGFLAGLLLIVKPNYWTFLIFITLWLAAAFPFNARILKKFAFMFLIAVAVLTFRISLDFYVNGETNFVGFSYINKFFGSLETTGKLLAFQEEIAEYPYRPSTLEKDLTNSHFGMKLKDKGVSLPQMFTQWKWHETSFNSFVGGYGYMNIWASGRFYKLMLLLYLGFGAYIIFSIIRVRDRKALKQFAIVTFGFFLTLFVSVMLSWIYAFQAQGRYFFPVIPMIGLFMYANRQLLNNSVVHAFLILTFLMSVYSFIFIGLARINSM